MPLLCCRDLRKVIMVDTDIMEKFQLPTRYIEQPNIWNDYTLLTNKYKPISLGQGFPDFLPPSPIINAFVDAIKCQDASLHQYTRRSGHPRLVKVLAKLYSLLLKQNVDPYQDILICSGGCATLHSVITGTVLEGDEVIVIEPSFNCYTSMVHAAGGIVKYISLSLKQPDKVVTSADWALDPNELQNAFNEKTKAIILNTPHNPFGKVFSYNELLEIANLCKKWNVVCISDEVYEWLVYDTKEHIRIASLPGMWELCITIGSAGKTFCVTGWKVGWAIGPGHLMKKLHLDLAFISNTIQQEAVAVAFENEFENIDNSDSYFKNLRQILQDKKQYIVRFLKEVGMIPIAPEGGIFVVADWTPLESKIDLSGEKDVYRDFRFTKWFTKNVGVLGIPVSMFYNTRLSKNVGERFVRFCFIKEDKQLEEAEKALERWIQR